jgi:uncharacterized membrane protein YfcA
VIKLETEYFGILIVIAFFAGAVDSIAGGGGLITLPALLFAGVPPQFSLGTNKFTGACGALISTFNFARRKLIDWRIFFWGAGFTLLGGFVGSKVILWFDPKMVQILILLFLPVAAASLFLKQSQKDIMKIDYRGPKAGVLALGLGFYDGFFGPGTGTFLTIGFHHVLGLNLVHAIALAKPFNLISSLIALSVFCFYGRIMWAIAIPMAIANMLGSWAGSQLAMRQGALLVRRALLGVCILLFVSLAIRLSLVYEWLSY